eukprot:365917-Chlamydomonas_euryale.AAC.22
MLPPPSPARTATRARRDACASRARNPQRTSPPVTFFPTAPRAQFLFAWFLFARGDGAGPGEPLSCLAGPAEPSRLSATSSKYRI